jgi:hypothetical protein
MFTIMAYKICDDVEIEQFSQSENVTIRYKSAKETKGKKVSIPATVVYGDGIEIFLNKANYVRIIIMNSAGQTVSVLRAHD